MPGTMAAEKQQHIKLWMESGFPALSVKVLQRPSAESWPNTFVIMWQKPTTTAGHLAYIALDVHYEGAKIEAGKDLLALGGLWAKDIPGDMKPQQEAEELRKKVLTEVQRVMGGDKSPDPTQLGVFGAYTPKPKGPTTQNRKGTTPSTGKNAKPPRGW